MKLGQLTLKESQQNTSIARTSTRSLLGGASRLLLGLLVTGRLLTANATVTGLVNTGSDGHGSLLAAGAIQPGWTITEIDPLNPPGTLTPANPPHNAYVVQPNVSWLPESASSASKWVSYCYPLYQGGDVLREYTYSLSFLAAAGDDVSFRVSADNSTRAYLNDKTSGLVFDWGTLDPYSWTPFVSWSPWIKVSDLQEGENTLMLVVRNLPQGVDNPTGLRVEFLDGPEPVVIPEPATWIAGALLLLPFGVRFCSTLRLPAAAPAQAKSREIRR